MNWFARIVSGNGTGFGSRRHGKMVLGLLPLLLLLSLCGLQSSLIWAQAANAAGISGGPILTPYGTPASNAPVRVCLITAIGTPCSTSGVTLYSDANLTSPIANPTSTNSQGIYAFFTVAGIYQIQVQATSTSTYTYYVSPGASGGGVVSPAPQNSVYAQTGTGTQAAASAAPGLSLDGANGLTVTGAVTSGGGFTQTGTGANTFTGTTSVPLLDATSIGNSGSYTQTGTGANTFTGATSVNGLTNSGSFTQTGPLSGTSATFSGTLAAGMGVMSSTANGPQFQVNLKQLGDLFLRDNGSYGNSGSISPATFGFTRSVATGDGGGYITVNMQTDALNTAWYCDDSSFPALLLEMGHAGNQFWTPPACAANGDPITLNPTYMRPYAAWWNSSDNVSNQLFSGLNIFGARPGPSWQFPLENSVAQTYPYSTVFSNGVVFWSAAPVFTNVTPTSTLCSGNGWNGTAGQACNIYGSNNDWGIRTGTDGSFNLDVAPNTTTSYNVLRAYNSGVVSFPYGIVQADGNSVSGAASSMILNDNGCNAASRNIKFMNSSSTPYGTLGLFFGAAGCGSYSAAPDFLFTPAQLSENGNSGTGPVPKIIFNDAATSSSARNWEIDDSRQSYGDLEFWVGASQGATPSVKAALFDSTGNFTASGVVAGTILQSSEIYSAAGTPLPACSSGNEGERASVSDATTPTYLGNYVSGGTVHAPVYCNGTTWVTD